MCNKKEKVGISLQKIQSIWLIGSVIKVSKTGSRTSTKNQRHIPNMDHLNSHHQIQYHQFTDRSPSELPVISCSKYFQFFCGTLIYLL